MFEVKKTLVIIVENIKWVIVMNNSIFLDNYEGQSTEELISLETTHRIDSLVLAFESAIDQKKETGKKISETENVVLVIEAIAREVNNGGFSQFFYNSSSEYTPDLVNSLELIDCPKTAILAKQAIALLDLKSLDIDSIEERINSEDEVLEQKLGLLDDKYYEGTEIIDEQLFQFIKENSTTIHLVENP